MLIGITDEGGLKLGFEQYARRLRAGAKRYVRRVGWHGGGGEFKVYWRPDQRFWSIIRTDVENRYWIAYGLDDPRTAGAAEVVCEINPPKAPMGRSGGMLLRDEKGHVHLAHNGMVAGGRKGISKTSSLKAIAAVSPALIVGMGRESR